MRTNRSKSNKKTTRHHSPERYKKSRNHEDQDPLQKLISAFDETKSNK